ncbi:MAG: NAD(P)-dependent oxidoreductase [candidate division KSB1 bacterium]|nr:NAD(P)-dependent oxidoreductase [candidate division KSB1 bacterium]
MNTVAELEEVMTTPGAALIAALRELPGDLLILGTSGKMGPSLARLAKRASDQAGIRRRVIGVARFANGVARQALEQAGVETIACDLLDPGAMQQLPEVENVVYMIGMKFGTTGREAGTWAVNAYLAAVAAQQFKHSRIVLFSTGNVYPLTPVKFGGCTEDDAPGPLGEYAQSALARERLFEYFCRQNHTPGVILRLNYAIDLRYGVLLDVAQKVYNGQDIDLSMGHVNVIWQGDANTVALRCLAHAQTPPLLLNVTGPETVSIRRLAEKFGELLVRTPVFVNEEAETALLSDAGRMFAKFGYPVITLQQMIAWTAHWVKIGGPTLNKPTHFETRTGRF